MELGEEEKKKTTKIVMAQLFLEEEGSIAINSLSLFVFSGLKSILPSASP